MTAKQSDSMKKIYQERRKKLTDYMVENDIVATVFKDFEEKRDLSVRYFSGHPSDALFIVFCDGQNVLVPWDENIANMYSCVDKILPFTLYERSCIRAVKTVLNSFKTSKTSKKQTFELPDNTPYPIFLQYVDALATWDVRCRDNSLHSFAKKMRTVKDDFEITCIKEACHITDVIIDIIEENVISGQIKTESDVALLIEKECRKLGCEKTGFDTLAAGPDRSFAIHCFPNYTFGSWPENGLSILDFGVVYNGYTSDVTLTVVKGEISEQQEKLISLVQKAYDECLKLYEKGVPLVMAAKKADSIFAKAKIKMPHSLGHGIGLEIHENPFVSARANTEDKFESGMVVTLEPGLYDPNVGGCRLENDILITENGNIPLTHSRIIRIK